MAAKASIAKPDVPVILLSHRAPVTFDREGDRRTGSRGAGGLVSALMGLASGLDGSVWVCAATGDEDRAVVEQYGDKGSASVEVSLFPHPGVAAEVETTDETTTTTLRMLAVDPEAHEQFYAQIANPLLWFVQHGLYGRAVEPDLGRQEHEAFTHGYVAVNEAFADAVAGEVEARGGRALVMLHDYHFYLVAARVRERCPDVTMSHFVHIPWPGPNEWTILPPSMRDPILRGLLGNDVVAFHTGRFARNFLLCVQELLGYTVNWDDLTVQVGERTVAARFYPISIQPEALEELAASDQVAEHRAALTERFLDDDRQLVLRVDRTDPSKNIVRGFKAFDTLLNDHPELKDRVVFFAMLQPSRQDVPQYQQYIAAIGAVVAEVNARHGGHGWEPIQLRMENDFALAVAAYQICDVLVVNALADGMNLVAKEAVLVNQRNGVLALSENTGAYQELGSVAVRLYPFDIQQQADAMYEALTMGTRQRADRLQAAADIVRRNDVGKWLDAQLADLEHKLSGR
ncbi:MAG: trehalose 6-phosphate synthase [Frankiales bacterium]|jgi:trehalose 6-phosphate synthase|nr:trehalose 6-phosphate synthase [Frankiales bacterium]